MHRLFITHPSQRRIYTIATRSFGLYSLPELQQPNDFIQAASNAIRQGDALRNALEHRVITTQEQARQALFDLDALSRIVCNVVDAAEICRNTHANRYWREASSQVFTVLSDYIAQLNGDTSLYNILQQISSQPNIMQQLSKEEQRFTILLKEEFEREGIHLPETERKQAAQLFSKTVQLESAFSQNMIASQQQFAADLQDVTDVIPKHVMAQYGMQVKDSSSVILRNDPQILGTLLRYSGSPSLRQQVYMESNTAVPENLPVLDDLIDVRHELSQLLGYRHYAQRFLKDKMAKNQETVYKFLHQLLKSTTPVYKKEMELIAAAKQAVEGSSKVEPWDPLFYVTVLKARDGFDINEISPYLSVEQSLKAMQYLVQKLFGIRMMEEEISESEAWDVDENGTKLGNGSIRRYRFVAEDESDLGTMYLDLYPRPSKYGGAAHFTIRCGCLVNGPDDPSAYQKPVVALVCNLSNTDHLAHAEVETLFHEFAHGLHSLLSRTSFQHMSGTRAAMDFVETPSHLFENFAWDPVFLKHLAKDQNGNEIPDDLIEKLCAQRDQFHGLEKHSQVVNALFDQALFGDKPTKSTSDILADLREQNGIPTVRGTHWHTRFGHLVSYGAGYYSYAYCQVFAADIWSHLFQTKSLDRGSGTALWKKMLIHGGAKDPSEILTDVLGRSPKIQ